MNSTETHDRSIGAAPWLRREWIAALLLFLATAAVVVWQNSRLGVLWDLSYILENSYRISFGDVPYRDFPLPHAPLTFLTQATLIRFTGRVFFHHVLYCAAVGGLATVLTWRILLNLLRGAVTSARLLAFLLSAPLTVLGIYCIFPHPFYDPDCTFAILVCILLLQQLESKRFPPLRAFLTGAALVVPLFVKQNTGLAFLGSAGLALAVLMGLEAWRRRSVSGYAWTMAGAATGLASALLLIYLTVGMANYKRWTIQFAASRRMPSLADMLAVYQAQALPWWIAAFVAGALLLWLNPQGKRVRALLSGSLMSVPFIWTSICVFIEKDSSERAEWLLALWPFLLIMSFVFALLSVRRRAGIALIVPYILIGTVHGAFLSQQLWGSTYALWPLLMLLVAGTITGLVTLLKERSAWEMVPLTSVVAVSMLTSGGYYIWSHERLDYAKLSEGEMVRSTLPALAGLSVRGSWIPQFEELVRFTEREIPRDEGLLMIPGEDLFYYTTGRHPRFPVLMLDHTVNPYSPEEILKLSRAGEIRWLIVKRDLQLNEDPVEEKDRLLELLRQDFKPAKSLDNYEVYRRKSSSASQPPSYRAVAVTFDDLPAPSDSVISDDARTLREMTSRLLSIIKANHIPAVGFVNEEKLYEDDNFKARIAILKMWLDAGLELGNHTFSHSDLQTTPLPAYEEDVIRGETVIKRLLREKGRRLRYFRYPFLNVGLDLGTRRAFERFLAGRGYTVAPVTINNREYMFAAVYARALARGDRKAAERVAQAYMSYMEQVFAYFEKLSVDVLGYELRQVLLLHADSLNSDHLNDLVGMMKVRGYRFISLDQALKDKAYHQPDTYSGEGGVSWIQHWVVTKGLKAPAVPDVPDFVTRQYEALSKSERERRDAVPEGFPFRETPR